jgi:protocatechuate 3,4-dioxygenase beta subunit
MRAEETSMTAQHPQRGPAGAPAPGPLFEGRPLANPDESVFDQGLQFDYDTLVDRRHVLKLIGFAGIGAGLLAMGCNSAAATPSATRAPTATAAPASPAAAASAAASPSVAAAAAPTSTPASAAPAGAGGGATLIPQETAGPFPGDGSNGPDVLTLSGVVRQDIRTSFGGASRTAHGVPLPIRLAIQDAANGCAPLANAAVYLWHCDREGRYSLYSQGVTDQNYLRGVQAAGADGMVTFTSIFPACYSGRWPHVHFEVYRNVAAATDPANRIATSQIALPEDACRTVYATDGYEQSVQNLSQVSLARDNVFGDDGGVHELGTVTGDVTNGMTVTLNVPVKAA